MDSRTSRILKIQARRFRNRALCVCFLLVFPLPALAAESLSLEGAERFAGLMERTAYRPSVSELENHYLDAGSEALQAFWESPRQAGPQLARAVDQQRFAYRHAIELCLPAVRNVTGQVQVWAAETFDLLGAENFSGQTIPVVVAFGDGRRGGTVTAGQVVIALEVLCRFARTRDEATLAFEAAVRHEMVHVAQLQYQDGLPEGVANRPDSLLRQALMEGLADWVAAYGLGQLLPQEIERAAYGANHEAELWTSFVPDMGGKSLGRWMYGPGAAGQPADLGYWIGKQVVDAYVGAQPAPGDALRTLLELDSPEEVLSASAYDPASLRD